MHCHYLNLNLKINENKISFQQMQTFSISFFFSNAMLLKNGFVCPTAIKTGTTIVGIVFKDGVILGADTRATEGPIVASKNCEKIHFLAKNM